MAEKIRLWTYRLDALLKEATENGALKRGNKIARQLPTLHVKIPKVDEWCNDLIELAAAEPPKETICLLEGIGGMGKSTCALELALRLEGKASMAGRMALL